MKLRRMLAVLMAVLMAAMTFLFTATAEEDWRSKLRSAFGLEDVGSDDTVSEAQPKTSNAGEKAEDWSLPITEPQRIVNYIDRFGKLPDNFITKNEARKLGWDSSYNYVGDVAPGKSIGGDRFGNYEGQLPKAKGRTWYECDTGYTGRKRGATRLLYSSDGLYYYTSDHYQTFTQMFPED